MDVAVHDGMFWVCGSVEGIAISSDAIHWTLLHHKPGGELLFSLAFPSPGTIEAFGTGSTQLISRNGGRTWNRGSSHDDRTFLDVRFADSTTAFAITDKGYGVTHDGGGKWKFHHAQAYALAVLDAQRAAVLVDKGKSEQVVTTHDGGRHWSASDWPKPWAWSDFKLF